MTKENIPVTVFRHLDTGAVISVAGTEIYSKDKALAETASLIFAAHQPCRLGAVMAMIEDTHQGAVEAIILACGERCEQLDHVYNGDEESIVYSDLIELDPIDDNNTPAT